MNNKNSFEGVKMERTYGRVLPRTFTFEDQRYFVRRYEESKADKRNGRLRLEFSVLASQRGEIELTRFQLRLDTRRRAWQGRLNPPHLPAADRSWAGS